MRLLHIIPGDLWAGAEAQVYYTVKEFYKFPQHKVSIILFCDGELYRRLLALNIDVTLLDERAIGNISICNGIRQKIINWAPHIIHVHEYKSHILTAIAKLVTGKKNWFLYRTIHGQTVPSSFKSNLVLGAEFFFLKYLTDHIITVSEQLKKQLSLKLTRDDIHLIYNAVDLNALPTPNDVPKIRQSFGLKENQFWIGTAARLERVKNLQMLIKAACYLRDKQPDMEFRISIFGEGSLCEVLRLQILQYDLGEYVFLEGHNNNIMPVLLALDVFALTSLHEGLPMSLLEAMSVGTIPVCTAVGGMKEVISHGEDGFLVGSGNAEELADTFAYIFSEGEELNSVRVNAFEKIKQHHSVEQNCLQLLTLYEN